MASIKQFQNINAAKNGFEALENLKQLHENKQTLPDIIFLDLNMPVLDGWQFLDELENLPFKNQLNIHLISSTIDLNEINKAKKYDIQVGLSINNILNTSYRDYLNRFRYFADEMGRNISLKIKIPFRF